MFCRFCGKQIQDDSDFCSYCGQSLTGIHIEKNTPSMQRSQDTFDNKSALKADSFYKQEAAQIAGTVLISITKVICYITLVAFLILGVDMAPSYGTTQTMCYILMAALAILLIVLFNKKVLTGKKKSLYQLSLVLALMVLVSTVGLRIVYESKVDYVTTQIPSSGEVKLKILTHTEYYNSTGTGTISNPRTSILLGNSWYESGEVVEVSLNQKYDIRVSAGGSGTSGGYIDSSITFLPTSFSNGCFAITKEIRFKSGPADLAEVRCQFTRYCTFWEVVFA